MNFTANLSLSLDEVDATSFTSVQTAAERIINCTENSRENKLSALLSTDVGRVVMTAIVQSHWRKISFELKESYRNDLLAQLLSDSRAAEPTSIMHHEALCESLLVLLRQDPSLLLCQQVVEKIGAFFKANADNWTTEKPVGYGLGAALRVIHTFSKHYEFVVADSSDDTTPLVLIQLVEDVVTPVVKKCLLPVLQHFATCSKVAGEHSSLGGGSECTASCVEVARLAAKILFRSTRAYPHVGTTLISRVLKQVPTFMTSFIASSKVQTKESSMLFAPHWKLYNRVLKILIDVENKTPELLQGRMIRDVLDILKSSVRVGRGGGEGGRGRERERERESGDSGDSGDTFQWEMPDKTTALSFDNIGNLCADHPQLWLADIRPSLNLFLRTSIIPRLSLDVKARRQWHERPMKFVVQNFDLGSFDLIQGEADSSSPSSSSSSSSTTTKTARKSALDLLAVMSSLPSEDLNASSSGGGGGGGGGNKKNKKKKEGKKIKKTKKSYDQL